MRRLKLLFGSKIWRNPFALFGGSFVALLVFVAALAPILAPYDPIERELLKRDQPPSREHWMGTDRLGRDVLSRVIYGARVSLVVGVIAQTVSMGLGITLGIVAGYFGGWVDHVVMWLVNVIWAFPYLLLVLAIQIALPNSPWTIFLAIGLAGWVQVARIVRGEVLSLREREFIEGPEPGCRAAPDHGPPHAAESPAHHYCGGDLRIGHGDYRGGGAFVSGNWNPTSQPLVGEHDSRRLHPHSFRVVAGGVPFPGDHDFGVGVQSVGRRFRGPPRRGLRI
jgi:hypothetical protein